MIKQNQPKQPSTVITNGKISIGRDLIFGWIVLGEQGWFPIDQCDLQTLQMIEKEINDAIFPLEVKNFVAAAVIAAENTADEKAS